MVGSKLSRAAPASHSGEAGVWAGSGVSGQSRAEETEDRYKQDINYHRVLSPWHQAAWGAHVRAGAHYGPALPVLVILGQQ